MFLIIIIIPFVTCIISNYILKMKECQHSDQQSKSSISNLSPSLHQKLCDEPQIESHFITSPENSNQRQFDNLYQNICKKKLQPKEWLQKAKSEKHLVNKVKHDMSTASKAAQNTYEHHQSHNHSVQDQIVLSNYKQLLRNHFQSQQQRDHELHQLHKRYHHQSLQNKKLLQQNIQLKKNLSKMAKQKAEQQQQVEKLHSNFKKLHRKYDNLLKEAEAREANMKAEMRRMRDEKASYQELIVAIKESIHILKGRKITALQQVWLQWRQIFELASLQQCNLSKKSTKH